MRFPELRIIGYIAIVAPLLFVTLWISSATIDGSWQFGVNSLSDMGISDNAVSAFLFNFGCMITGVLGMIVGAGLIVYGKRTLKVGGAVYIIGMLFLSLVGVFTLDNYDMHRFVATSFSVASGLAIVISSVSDWKVSWYLYTDITVIGFSITAFMVTHFEMWEPLITIASMIWVLILGIKILRKEEELFNITP